MSRSNHSRETSELNSRTRLPEGVSKCRDAAKGAIGEMVRLVGKMEKLAEKEEGVMGVAGRDLGRYSDVVLWSLVV